MSAGVKSSLGDGKNGRSWETLVGYTVADLMAHLERQFLPGMSWDNRGEWHIDHIRPLCSFEFTSPDDPQFREADRKSVVSGKSVSVRVDLGGCRTIKKTTTTAQKRTKKN